RLQFSPTVSKFGLRNLEIWKIFAPLAQLAEQVTLNQSRRGASDAALPNTLPNGTSRHLTTLTRGSSWILGDRVKRRSSEGPAPPAFSRAEDKLKRMT